MQYKNYSETIKKQILPKIGISAKISRKGLTYFFNKSLISVSSLISSEGIGSAAV